MEEMDGNKPGPYADTLRLAGTYLHQIVFINEASSVIGG